MSDRAAFLRAIAADPADDTARLAFADWLDENGEPDRAEFIRVQIRLGDTDRRKSWKELGDLADWVRREEDLLKTHRDAWLGPLAGQWGHEFDIDFRRGFVDKIEAFGSLLIRHDEAIAEYCPALTELHVIGVRDNGEKLARLTCLNPVRTLRLEDWPYPDDAKALARSPHIANLETLSVWLGSENDAAVCKAFGASKAMPDLRRVELYELQSPSSLSAGAQAAAKVIDKSRGKRSNVATVVCPNESLFTLGPDVGWDFHGGTLPDGRLALVSGGRECEVLYFDAHGTLTAGELLDVSDELHSYKGFRDYDHDELFGILARRIGFRPGKIRVKEFWASSVLPNSGTCVHKFDGDVMETIESPDGDHDRLRWDTWEHIVNSVHFWTQSTNFCISGGGDTAWVDDRGYIHTT